MLQQAIQHEVELVFAAPVKRRPKQIAHRTTVIPLPMTAPLAAGGNESVGGRYLEQARPVGAFARNGEFIAQN